MVNKMWFWPTIKSGVLEEGAPEWVFGKGQRCWIRGMEGDRADQ